MSVDIALNLKEIHLANRRVEDALNRRFERDAEMYISNQDIAFIKECLSKGEFDLMYSKYKAENFHPDVFFKTILRNAWLIKDMKQNHFTNIFRPILKEVHPEFSKKLLNEVAENKLDVPEIFRSNLLGHYAKTVDPLEAEEMIENASNLGLKRLKVLVQRVLGHYAGSPLFFTKWNSYLKQFPALGGDDFIISRIPVEEEKLRKHLELIVAQVEKIDWPPQYLLAPLRNGKIPAFEILLQKARTVTEKVARQPKGVRDQLAFDSMKKWLKILRTVADQILMDKGLEDKYDWIYQELRKFYDDINKINTFQAGQIIRYCLGKSKSAYLKDKFSSYFENAYYHGNFEDDVEALKGMEFQSEFDDVEGLMDSLDETSSDELKRLEYLAICFSKLPNLDQHMNKFLSQFDLSDKTHVNFLMVLLRDRKQVIWTKVLEYAERNSQMDKLIFQFVCKNVPQNAAVKTYMHRNHFQKYSELYGL